MCGILYVKLRDDTDARFPDIFKEALQLMSYRGKDNIGYYRLLNNYFGHVRLSMMDHSSRSHQPIVNPNTISLFKGEIYNYKSLNSDAFSDTLAISKFIEEGNDLSDKICGMYAILSFNKHTQQVKVLRDLYGEKPVYYYMDDNIFIVSSTIKAITYILHKTAGIQLKINSLSLYDYFLHGFVREPKTIYENIHLLSSGHTLIFLPEWKIEINNNVKKIVNGAHFNEETHLAQCINTTDMQPTLLLSSGVDSTYILNAMADTIEHFNILTYRSPDARSDESGIAVLNGEKICKNKKINVIDNHEDLIQLYASYPLLLEQPTSDGINLFNILSIFRKQDADSKFIILGTGGDELYGGYHSFKNFPFVSLLKKMPYVKNWLPQRYRRFFEVVAQKNDFVEVYYFCYRICSQLLPYVPQAITEKIFSDFSQEMKKYQMDYFDAYHKIKIFESFDYMRNQLLRDADTISLFCGFEARNPLLSIKGYFAKPDNKQLFRKELFARHGLTFPKKRGFHFEGSSKIRLYLQKAILNYNNYYNLISVPLMQRLMSNNANNLQFLSKIYNLLAWLDANKIDSSQLNGCGLHVTF